MESGPVHDLPRREFLNLVSSLITVSIGSLAVIDCQASVEEAQATIEAFNAEWRVILLGKSGAELAERAGARKADTPIAAPELDALERLLLPLLDADLARGSAALLSASRQRPAQYYRQYAPATLHSKRAIIVNGFHMSYLDRYNHVNSNPDSWRTELVDVSDGGTAYWLAIYMRDEGRFASMRRYDDAKGAPTWTVLFNGLA